MDRRLLRGVRALRGQARRHRGDPVRDAVAPAQRAARRVGAAAPRRAAVPHRAADARATGIRCRCARPARARRSAGLRLWSSALGAAGFVVDCTIEGLMHAPETPAILKAGARIHGDLQRAPRGARAHGAGRCAGGARARGGENAARREAHDRDVAGRQQPRCRHGGRADRRRLGLDRQARHARRTGRAASW